MIHIAKLTILAGNSESEILDGHRVRWLKNLFISPPAVLAGITTVATSAKSERDDKSNPTHVFQTLQSEGADVVITDDKVLVLNQTGWGSMRIETDTPPGADEEYELVGQDDPGF